MSRINSVSMEEAKGEVKEQYQILQKKVGKLLNIFANMGNSPAALKGYMALDEAASHSSIEPKVRELIALIVGQTNQCNYCLSAHTAIAKSLGVKEQDILKAREGEAQDPKTQAILKFVKTVVENRAHVSNQDIASLKATGVTDQELVDLVLLITVNLYTNYFNLITDPKIDFPLAPELN